MKTTGVVLVGIASGLVAAVATFAVITNMQKASGQTDDEFLSEVREGAATSKAPALQTASLAPANSDGSLVPVIEIETDHYDMGVIANDKNSEGQVMVHNRGKAPLNISKVNTQCGCTKGAMSKETIPPGESAPLIITIDPFRIPQFDSTKTLTLFTNDPANPTVKLQVSARVNPELRMVPEDMQMGTVTKGESAEQTVRVIQNTETPLNIKKADIIGQAQFWEYNFKEIEPEKWENPDRREYLVTAKLLPDAPTGNLRANLVLETDFKRLPRATVPIIVDVKGVYNIEPQVVTLRSVEAGKKVEGVMKVTAEVPVEIVEVKTGNEFLTVTHHPGEKPNSFVFDVAIAENPTQRWQRDTWTIKLKAQDQEFTEDVKVMAIINGIPGDESPAAISDETKARIEEIRKRTQEQLDKLKESEVPAPESAAPAPSPAPESAAPAPASPEGSPPRN